MTQRFTAFALAVVVGVITRQRPFSDVGSVRGSLLAGVFGASGVAATVHAGRRGPLAPVIVAGSMYPAVTVGLAWIFLRDRLTPRQIVGLAGALAGVALIALD